jgi:diguanylate cyclase (GGDEF)-like protein
LINITKKIALQALDSGMQALVIVNAQKRGLPVVYVNSAFETLTGLAAGDVVGGRLDELASGDDVPERPGQWLQEDGDDVEQLWRRNGAEPLRVNLRRTALFDRPGRPSFWMLTAIEPRDVATPDGEVELRNALHDARRKLKRLERTDPATGIPNAAAFHEILRRDWKIARREQKCLGVAIFQVDYLEEYRDSLGRHATDSVLGKVAHAINGSLRRAGDFGARVDDDRFAVVLGAASDDQVADFSARVLKKVASLAIPHPRSPVARMITISYGGAAEVPEWKSVFNTLLDTAEQRLAAALDARPIVDPTAEKTQETRTDLARSGQ